MELEQAANARQQDSNGLSGTDYLRDINCVHRSGQREKSGRHLLRGGAVSLQRCGSAVQMSVGLWRIAEIRRHSLLWFM